MKKFTTLVFALLLAGSLSFAQNTGGDKKTTPADTTQSDTGKKPSKTSKAHKGGKKHKKGSSSSSTGSTTPK